MSRWLICVNLPLSITLLVWEELLTGCIRGASVFRGVLSLLGFSPSLLVGCRELQARVTIIPACFFFLCEREKSMIGFRGSFCPLLSHYWWEKFRFYFAI